MGGRKEGRKEKGEDRRKVRERKERRYVSG